MCANYEQLKLYDYDESFGVPPPTFPYPWETWPTYTAPILIRDEIHGMALARATFGLIPFWAKSNAIARQTYNARTETVAKLPSFRNAWKRRQFCLIPVARFFEPNYESGKAVRWGIGRRDGKPFALAGIWESKQDEQGIAQRSFSMLTINAAEHPLMRRFHGPEDEKRSVVVVEPQDYARWLRALNEDEARDLLRLMDLDAFQGEPAPLPPRKSKAATSIPDIDVGESSRSLL